MEMGAISSRYGLEESVPAAIEAGVDLLCFGNNQRYDPDIAPEAVSILERAVRSGRLTEERIAASAARIRALQGPPVPRCNGHRFTTMSRPSASVPTDCLRHPPSRRTIIGALSLLAFAFTLAGCQRGQPRAFAPRKGDEIVVAGQLFHIGTPVVTWMDPGGYDAAGSNVASSRWRRGSSESQRAPFAPAVRTPNRYRLRQGESAAPEEVERVRGGGWDLPTLQRMVDSSSCTTMSAASARPASMMLHDQRGLSVHFMLDVDGTIYQTLDLKERAWHATTSNDRSIGIEIANMGAYRATEKHPFARWYGRDAKGTVLTVPPNTAPTPCARRGLWVGPTGSGGREKFSGDALTQSDLTPQQSRRWSSSPPRSAPSSPRSRVTTRATLRERWSAASCPTPNSGAYQGVLGTFHIQTNKVDPGPALQWDRVINRARQLLGKR
jgi:hypothetical protein